MLRTITFAPPAHFPTRWRSLKNWLVSLYMDLTCYELKTYLKAEGCRTSGLKADLVERLATWDADKIQTFWATEKVA